jgi:hypothetical protein
MKQVDKVERYDWVKPGDNGRQCKVAVDELKIDHAYQRLEVSEQNTLALARGFNWVAFNSIVVMQRANGDKYVVDGQQRLLAARRRGDIREVPCVLFESDGREHEARAFISLNVRRVNVPAVAKFNASVRAALNPEKQIADWLATQGLTVTEDGKDINGVDFPTSFMQLWKLDDDAAKLAIQIQRDVNGTEPLHSVCHKGLWWLLHNGIDVLEHADKLKRMGGLAAILRSVKTLEIETGAKASVRGCGIGVLRLINYKRRGNKIAIPEDA